MNFDFSKLKNDLREVGSLISMYVEDFSKLTIEDVSKEIKNIFEGEEEEVPPVATDYEQILAAMRSEENDFILKVLNECGFRESLLGLSLNKKQPMAKMDEVSLRLIQQSSPSHFKFLRHIQVWMLIKAPLKWWKQFDTYTFADSQSESTMFTILKEPLSRKDFNFDISETQLKYLNSLIETKQFERLTDELPCGFMQIREINTNYASLKNMIDQRKNHKLKEWKDFCFALKCGLKDARLIFPTE